VLEGRPRFPRIKASRRSPTHRIAAASPALMVGRTPTSTNRRRSRLARRHNPRPRGP
jgi:hypothetical protein